MKKVVAGVMALGPADRAQLTTRADPVMATRIRAIIAIGHAVVVAVAVNGCALTKLPGSIVDNDVPAIKHGTACTLMVAGIAVGDSSLGTAMQLGGIEKVSRFDYDLIGVPLILGRYCTVVQGQ